MRITGEGIWGPPQDRPEALRTLKRVPELGIDFIDTADSYGPDVSEELIREALYPYDGMLIATKAGFRRRGPGVWEMDGNPKRLREQAIRSCEKLGVEQIGLWQLHRIDPKVPREAQFAAVKSLLDDGIIKHAGLSEVSVADIKLPPRCSQWRPAEPLQSGRLRQRGRARFLRAERPRLHPVVSARRRRARQERLDPRQDRQGPWRRTEPDRACLGAETKAR
jgi:aryl-alcohol dehydrogenase-like predicted oxidoreductase